MEEIVGDYEYRLLHLSNKNNREIGVNVLLVLTMKLLLLLE